MNKNHELPKWPHPFNSSVGNKSLKVLKMLKVLLRELTSFELSLYISGGSQRSKCTINFSFQFSNFSFVCVIFLFFTFVKPSAYFDFRLNCEQLKQNLIGAKIDSWSMKYELKFCHCKLPSGIFFKGFDFLCLAKICRVCLKADRKRYLEMFHEGHKAPNPFFF